MQQKKNTNEIENFNTKLTITDYVFNYNKEDLSNATLTYYFDKIKHVELKYENGKKIYKTENFSPIITFLISAEDKKKKNIHLNFL